MRAKYRVRAVCLCLVAMGVLSLGLVRVHGRHQIIRAGYELSEARATLRTLQEEQNRLRVEESVLTNPDRIETLARSLGMVRPKPEQLRVIPASESVASLQ